MGNTKAHSGMKRVLFVMFARNLSRTRASFLEVMKLSASHVSRISMHRDVQNAMESLPKAVLLTRTSLGIVNVSLVASVVKTLLERNSLLVMISLSVLIAMVICLPKSAAFAPSLSWVSVAPNLSPSKNAIGTVTASTVISANPAWLEKDS